MISLIQNCLLLSLVSFSFSLLIDVCLGYPGSKEAEHVNSKAIFFFFSFFLAQRRLVEMGLYDGIFSSYKDHLFADDDVVRAVANKNFKEAVFSQGREYFTWELGFGMCPVCTNIRFAIIFALICILIGLSWYSLIIIPCFSNLYLLIFNKLKI